MLIAHVRQVRDRQKLKKSSLRLQTSVGDDRAITL